jgi:tetratricopeptide (TPR) repeat protein
LDTPESRAVLNEANGIFAKLTENYLEAEKCFQEAAEIREEINCPYNQLRALVQLIRIYELMAEGEKAREVSKQAEKIYINLSLELVDFPEYGQSFQVSPLIKALDLCVSTIH